MFRPSCASHMAHNGKKLLPETDISHSLDGWMDGYIEFGTTAVAYFLGWSCHVSNQSCQNPAIMGEQDDGCNYYS